MLDGLVSIVALSIVGGLCVVGVFHPRFNDNFVQRVGLSMLGIWCILRIYVKVETMDTEPVHLFLHIGLALYAISTAYKLCQIDKRRKGPRELSITEQRQVSGGSGQ
jgi:threonine/homoserine efflux transporter RhtA